MNVNQMSFNDVEAWMRNAGPGSVLTLDGAACAGKTSFAERLHRVQPDWTLIHMDDLIPGWDGLNRAVTMVRDELIVPLLQDRAGTWHEWDWNLSQVVGQHQVQPGTRIVIEGSGSTAVLPPQEVERFRSSLNRPRFLQLWLAVDETDRRKRIVERDGDAFDAFWPVWDAEWLKYTHQNAPQGRAYAVSTV